MRDEEFPVIERFEVRRRSYLASDGTVRNGLPGFASDAGFLYVTLDLAGYKSGSLNAVLKKGKSKKALPLISS